ncbi:beta-ketoacyl synthase chain length factor [Colwellia piezophila]|uniref:beta-ketoacyl synthase chain length factor n=1 Tax=Colwellia piezophila TaxID=211668 RepID=UPI00036503C7|nr:beta-ketoacyl synthase chain length factor [Colwellia piezophila]
MDFCVNIKNIIIIEAQSSVVNVEGFQEKSFIKADLPKLAVLKPMQRRRLSPFAKLAMHCALDVIKDETQALVSVFSSRHGDLHKTSTMLHDLALGEDISPTAFSLSVHNAIAGLFTIFTQNRQASTTVSAGQDTFMMALVEAYIRLKTGQHEQVLLVHCDQALPSPYAHYADELQIDHGVALILTKDDFTGQRLSIKRVNSGSLTGSPADDNVMELPQAISFCRWLNEPSKPKTLMMPGHQWKIDRLCDE